MAVRTTTQKRTSLVGSRRRSITPQDLLKLVGVGDTHMSPEGTPRLTTYVLQTVTRS
jgi:hypothetical protein